MRRKWKWITLIAALTAVAIWCENAVVSHIAEKNRQAVYQSQLVGYRSAVKIGTTRSDIESYLQSSHLAFRHICCALVEPTGGWDDLVKIGSEPAPRYCNYSNVYIAFDFPRTADVPLGSDKLQNVVLYPYLEECM